MTHLVKKTKQSKTPSNLKSLLHQIAFFNLTTKSREIFIYVLNITMQVFI